MSILLREESSIAAVPNEPADIEVCYFGPGLAKHTMPCAVNPQECARLDTGKGVFEPGSLARHEGWKLLQIRPGRVWLFKLLRSLIFTNH